MLSDSIEEFFQKQGILSEKLENYSPREQQITLAKKIATILFTTNKDAPAKKFVKKTLVFPKQREPYTYNTTTYLSMILASTKETTKKILSQ